MSVQLKIQVNTQQSEIELLGKIFEDTEEALGQAVLFNKLAQDNGFVGRYGFHCYVDRREELPKPKPEFTDAEFASMRRVRDRITELLEGQPVISDGIVAGYLRSLQHILQMCDLKHYRELYKMLGDYEKDYKVTLTWKHEIEL